MPLRENPVTKGLLPETSGRDQAVVLIKAAPQIGAKHGETVCCAGISVNSQNWLRLYPINFRQLEKAQQFSRWDIIEFDWRLPKDDKRIESRRVTHETIEITGKLKKSEREKFLAHQEVGSLKDCRNQNQSLALLRPKNPKFEIVDKSKVDIKREREGSKDYFSQLGLFQTDQSRPIEPCPFKFIYHYEEDGVQHKGTCQDWETDATFFNWARQYGEAKALKMMTTVFGEEYPKNGMVFAMGTHSQYPNTWLINGIIRMDEILQGTLF